MIGAALARLPLTPPPMIDEPPSSWMARVAARYDLAPATLARHLLPNETNVSVMYRLIDSCAAPPLEAAFVEAVGRSDGEIGARRRAGLISGPHRAWPRLTPVWCPRCVAQDVASTGEVHGRRAWGFGG